MNILEHLPGGFKKVLRFITEHHKIIAIYSEAKEKFFESIGRDCETDSDYRSVETAFYEFEKELVTKIFEHYKDAFKGDKNEKD